MNQGSPAAIRIENPRILVSTFAYNEHVKIEATISRIFEADLQSRIPGSAVEVVVVDDGSSDEYPKKLQERFAFTLLRNDTNKGIGFSIRRVIEYGLQKGFDVLVIMAGNNKDEPLEIPQLVAPVLSGEADFVQGSRYLAGGGFGVMPVYRRLATQAVHPMLVWLVTGKRLHDTTNGFRAIRLSTLKEPEWHLNQEWLDRYGLEYYILFKYLKGPYRSTEVPVTKTYPPKQLGYTKIKPFSGWWDILKPIVLLGLRIKK